MNRTHLRTAGRVACATAAFAAIAFGSLVFAGSALAAEGCASVEVRNVRPGQGMLMVAAYGDAATFSKQPMVATQMRAPADATATVQVCGLTGSTVAFTLFQDLNGNGKLDANVFGIPSEPWGASGTVKPMSGPTWEGSAVALDGKPIVVTLSK